MLAPDFEAGLAIPIGHSLVVENPGDGSRQRRRIIGWDKVSILARLDQFWQRGCLGSDNGQSGGSGLQCWYALDLYIRGDGKDVGVAIESG